MKPINILKALENQKTTNDKSRLNTTEEKQKIDKIYKFIDTYIILKLKSLDVSQNVLDELVSRAFELVFHLNDLTEVSENEPLIKVKEVNFLNSADTKIKKAIGNKIADHIIRWFTYADKKRKYIEEYITPMLEKLDKENIITYNPKELDNKTKIATNRIDKLVNKIIDDFLKDSIYFKIFENYYNNEYIILYDFLFSDNTQAKKDFANDLQEYIKQNIDTIDFKNIDNIDFSEITGAKIDKSQ